MNLGSNYFNDYYHALDRGHGTLEPSDTPPSDTAEAVEASSLGPQEIGTGTNPMQHQVRSFEAKIREGAGKVEFEFMGQGKTNSQQPGPEAFGMREREDIRGLADINKVKTSVHAAWHQGGLAGMGREGFTEQARQQSIHEISKAIDFAADTTRGGAIVFHTGEWQRPLTELRGTKEKGEFEAYPYETEKTPIQVVDSQTGDITAIRRDQVLHEPKFYTAEEYEKKISKNLVGQKDRNGNIVSPDDWVDIEGNAIKREWAVSDDPDKIERLFDRVPVWNKEKTNFETERREFDYFEKEAEKLREKGIEVKPELLFFKTKLADQVSQSKGQSLFYAYDYDRLEESRNEAEKALEFYEKLEGSLPEDEKWKLMRQRGFDELGLIPPKNVSPKDFLKEKIKNYENRMRHIHESSASADARAKDAMERIKRVTTVEDYGLEKTADSISRLGIRAMKKTQKHPKRYDEPLFVAPESWRIEEYGSHPDEFRKIIEASRNKMAQQLRGEGYSEGEAKKLAKQHIKATLDIGHFNLWRQRLKAKEGETPEERDKRFNKWLLKETKKLAKEGIVGHVHLTDNFGYDDEHLTPGEGNVPMKEFIKNMEDAGLKDFIVEAGSFNTQTAMPDTWALMGSPVYSTTRAPTFRSMHEQHFGYHNPSTYIVGAYAPSNEWSLWSEVPME